MSVSHTLATLAPLAASQWGMFTTAQAEALGVSRLRVSRLHNAGALTRIAQGVYRDGLTPETEFDLVRAVWLSIDPALTINDRLTREYSVIAGGKTAAFLHGIGGWYLDEVEFSTTQRRQTQRPGIRLRTRTVPTNSITTAHGVLTTTIEQTLADLIASGEDLSTVADAYADAAGEGRVNDQNLATLLAPMSKQFELDANDGGALVQLLRQSSHTDAASLAQHIAQISPGLAKLTAYFSEQLKDEHGNSRLGVAMSSITAEFNRALSEEIPPMKRMTELMLGAEANLNKK